MERLIIKEAEKKIIVNCDCGRVHHITRDGNGEYVIETKELKKKQKEEINETERKVNPEETGKENEQREDEKSIFDIFD